jgi:hypothetical protein
MKFKSFNIVKTCSIIKNFNFQQENLCIRILFSNYSFSPLNTFLRNGKDLDPDPYLWLTDPGPKHTDPTDPEVEHCKEEMYNFHFQSFNFSNVLSHKIEV